MNQFVINTDLTLEEVKSALRQGAEALKRLDEIKSVVNYAPSNTVWDVDRYGNAVGYTEEQSGSDG